METAQIVDFNRQVCCSHLGAARGPAGHMPLLKLPTALASVTCTSLILFIPAWFLQCLSFHHPLRMPNPHSEFRLCLQPPAVNHFVLSPRVILSLLKISTTAFSHSPAQTAPDLLILASMIFTWMFPTQLRMEPIFYPTMMPLLKSLNCRHSQTPAQLETRSYSPSD